MSDNKEQEQEIENAAASIISQLIDARKGEQFQDLTQVITFVAVICSNAATLEHANFTKMPILEQVNIAFVLFPEIYKQLEAAHLVPHDVECLINDILSKEKDLKEKLQLAIATYDLTAQITGLPEFKDIKKSGVSAIGNELKKLKFRF